MERLDFLSALSRAQREVVDQDLNEVERFLASEFVPENVRSLILFKSNDELNRVIRVPVRTADMLVIDVDPYTFPLESVLEADEKVLVVEVAKERTRLSTYHLGFTRELDVVKSFVPTDTVDASRPGKVQRHRLTHLHWHLKLSAGLASRYFREHQCAVLVLIGEKRVSELFVDCLPEALREKIIAKIHGSPFSNGGEWRPQVENALSAYRADREEHALRAFGRHKARGVLAAGLREVVEACNLFLIRKLYVGLNCHSRGYICRAHHYLALEPVTCPFCGQPLLEVSDVVDEVIEICRLHRTELMIVERKQELLAGYGGIAAVLLIKAPIQIGGREPQAAS
jgi:peptide chain release factor subunit 1